MYFYLAVSRIRMYTRARARAPCSSPHALHASLSAGIAGALRTAGDLVPSVVAILLENRSIAPMMSRPYVMRGAEIFPQCK